MRNLLPSTRQRRARIADDRFLSFDSVSNHNIEIAHSPKFNFDNTTSFSLSCFCNSVKASGTDILISKRIGGGSEGWALFISLANDDIRWVVNDGTNAFTAIYSPTDLSDLMSIFATFNTSEIRLYVNGVLRAVVSTPSIGDISNTGNIFIGSQLSANYHSGLISNVAIYDGVPTADTVLHHHALGGVVSSSLRNAILGYWPLTQKYYFDDSGTIRAWDIVEDYNLDKITFGYSFTQGQGSDVGTLVQFGLATGSTNGDGLITLVSVSGSSSDNLVGYSIDDPFSFTIQGTTRVIGNITSSGGTNINLVIRKSGVPDQSIDISVAGDFDFDLIFANSNNSAFEILLQDENANDAGATFQVNSLTINHVQRGIQTSSHGVLNNFSSASVGTSEPATQTNIFDKLSKQVSSNWGLTFNGTNQRAFLSPLTSSIVLGIGNFSIYFDIRYISNSTQDVVFDTFQASTTNPSVRFFVQGSSNVLAIQVSESDTVSGQVDFTLSETLQKNQRIKGVFTIVDVGDNTTWDLQLVGNSVSSRTNQTNTNVGNVNITSTAFHLCSDSAGSNHANIVVNDIQFYNVLLGGEERISLLRDSIIPSGLIERVNPEKRSDNQINTTLNNQLILTNFTLANYDNYYVDRETGLPEIKEYLQLDSTKSINIPSAVFSQISGEDIDVVLEYQKGTIPVAATEIYLDFFNSTDNQRLQHTVQIGNPSRLRSIFTTSSDTTQRFRDMILGIDDRSISLTLSLFERGNVTINSGIQLRQFQNGEATGSNSGSFGSQDLPIVWSNFTANSLSGDMKFISLTIIERNGQRFNQKSMLRKWDNSFLSTKFDLNPGDQIIAHYNSNGSSYSEDGTDVLLREYVTDDGTTDATVTGFTGATSALELADLLTNVANINTLR